MLEFMSLAELASKLAIGKQAARNLCQAKGFPAHKVGREWRISVSKFERWVETEFGGKVVKGYQR